MTLVSSDHLEPDGPTHDFYITKREVTNAQFVAFLNDALANLDNERGFFLFFDVDTGAVFINNAQTGEIGTDGSGTLMFDPTVAGRITFDGQQYAVAAGFDDHPVAGVTWYGTLKYCNNLTLKNAQPLAMRTYSEGTQPDNWHPITVDDATWANGVFDDVNRQALIDQTVGVRLPMDNETTAASLYNEWYKASAWDDRTAANHSYGFGRDQLRSIDANSLDNGDTDADSTTPVGFFDGINFMADGITRTAASDNFYALLDTTGNVAEWIQGFFTGSDAGSRAARGGSWRDADPADLATTARRQLLPTDSRDDVGFRVVRGTGRVATLTLNDRISGVTVQRFIILDVREPLLVTPSAGLDVSGTYGDGFAGRSTDYTVENRSASDMDWSVKTDQTWVEVAESNGGATTGSLAAGASINVTAKLTADVDLLIPGTHDATVTITNDTATTAQTRTAKIDIAEPITVSPDEKTTVEFVGLWGGPFSPDMTTYSLTNVVAFDLDYDVTADQNWLTIDNSPTNGTIQPGQTLDFDVRINSVADSLDVGEYPANLTFRFTDPNNGVTDVLTRTLRLIVNDPLLIEPEDPWKIEFAINDPLPSRQFTLTNQHKGLPIDVETTVDQDWLDVDKRQVTIDPAGGQAIVTVSFNENARSLGHGEFDATISFADALTGFTQSRAVHLRVIENLSIRPFSDFTASGQPGGPIMPIAKVYTIKNIDDGAGDIDYQVSLNPTVDWLMINGKDSDGGTLSDGQQAKIRALFDLDATRSLGAGTHETDIILADLTNDEQFTRHVSLTLSKPIFTMLDSLVPKQPAQPSGPDYSFFCATFDTTNNEFAAFLNDALANKNNERGFFLFHDTDTGDVYINDKQPGEQGTDGNGTLIYSSAKGRISFDGSQYVVDKNFQNHPVVGVSWFGAVKYANWLTLDQGMLPSNRCYTEATSDNLDGWHPVTISDADWANRDLNDAERQTLVEQYPSFRLPMDNGVCRPGQCSTFDSANPYNEWYKAAAWNPNLSRNTIYGFGRDTIDGADANYIDSGDPFDNSTTPGGYYDGTDHGGAFQTNPNDNAFGLFDQAGNAFQWIQGRNNTDNLNSRNLRGGSFESPASGSGSVEAARRLFTQPTRTSNQISFRVVRTLPTADGDADRDGDVDLDDLFLLTLCISGPDSPIAIECSVFDFDSDNDVDLHDVAAFQNVFTP